MNSGAYGNNRIDFGIDSRKLQFNAFQQTKYWKLKTVRIHSQEKLALATWTRLDTPFEKIHNPPAENNLHNI